MYTERDEIRIGCLKELARRLAHSGGGGPCGVHGSAAMILHYPTLGRVPNDLDVIDWSPHPPATRAQAVEGIEQRLVASSFKVVRSRKIEFFDSSVKALIVECLVEVWGNTLRDIIPLSVKYEPDALTADWRFVDDVRVLSAEHLIADKFHALFKRRESSVVSSRSRDLVDLYSLHRAGEHGPLRSGAGIAASRLLVRGGITLEDPPLEWKLPWQGYCLASGTRVSLFEAWQTLRTYLGWKTSPQ